MITNPKKVLGWSRIFTIVEASTVFQVALLGSASSLICAHNHSSGNLKARHADISLTARLTNAAKLLGITVDDSIILT